MNPLTTPQAQEAVDYEETLRQLARVPAPDGLAERIHNRLASAPRRGHLLAWPAAERWLRPAAAAAIVLVVAGGAFGVATHVHAPAAPQAVAPAVQEPAAVSGGGFSSAGAMRTPQTLPGPAIRPARLAKPALPAAPAGGVRATPRPRLAQPAAGTARGPRHSQ